MDVDHPKEEEYKKIIMARYTGPKTKISRKFGEPLFGPDKSFDKKNYPPGQHGLNKRRQKKSEYAIQLMEKQKAKYLYGILERQFRNLFEKANKSKGITGEVLLQLCESRLDNLVYRMGIAPTRSAAMVIGIFPSVGIPLPFISYGGSSMLAFTILFAGYIKIDSNKKERW